MIEYIFDFWWMFPIAFCVCLMATSSSVESAVFFTPIFINSDVNGEKIKTFLVIVFIIIDILLLMRVT